MKASQRIVRVLAALALVGLGFGQDVNAAGNALQRAAD
ncbi:TPA: entericidin A/B family lipoprotein [Burkholderia vietnamiensis]|nr:entericidin A/B family lipoprotein [Burkholderia vietnamiensis]HDR8978766.1 entericidin A/B family lipoprotein [Burkholderia vietnamiensis]HDR9069385.1 entericidin A/B family lipoprotein [Burkholderia vietnamiensis]